MLIKISGLNVIEKPKSNRSGDTIVAYIDFSADFISMRGAALVRLSSGSWSIWEPLAFAPDSPRRPVRMLREARKAVASQALPLFEALGGTIEQGTAT